MTWLPRRGDGAAELEQVLGLCPGLRADLRAFAALFEGLPESERELIELCRVRVAQILGAGAERDRGWLAAIAAGRRDELVDWRRSDGFSPLERAALHFAEQFVLDPHGISDRDAEALTTRLSPPQMVAFVEALAIIDGFTRFRLMLGIDAGTAAS